MHFTVCFTLQDARRSQSTPLSVRLTRAFRHTNENIPRAAAVCCDGLKRSAATDHDQTVDGISEASTVYYCIEEYTNLQNFNGVWVNWHKKLLKAINISLQYINISLQYNS